MVVVVVPGFVFVDFELVVVDLVDFALLAYFRLSLYFRSPLRFVFPYLEATWERTKK